MYVTQDKVFLHMVKSAGISVHNAMIQSPHQIHVNQRHASIGHLPKCYTNLPRYGLIRSPEEWYKSFYRFFLNVEGYMSFMLNDLGDDGYIHPIEFNEFVKRSINMEQTLLKYPNKARVFNNVLQSQGQVHFVNAYFIEAIDIDNNNNFGDTSTLEQFNMSLYEWYFRGCGMNTSINIPMNKLEDIEELYGFKLPHDNQTKNEHFEAEYTPEVLELVRSTHKKFYDEIDNYKGLK